MRIYLITFGGRILFSLWESNIWSWIHIHPVLKIVPSYPNVLADSSINYMSKILSKYYNINSKRSKYYTETRIEYNPREKSERYKGAYLLSKFKSRKRKLYWISKPKCNVPWLSVQSHEHSDASSALLQFFTSPFPVTQGNSIKLLVLIQTLFKCFELNEFPLLKILMNCQHSSAFFVNGKLI